MSLIENIRKDREAGTAGPWGADVDGFGGNRLYALGFDTHDGAQIFAQFRDAGPISWEQAKTNTRRAARVPQMEAALLDAHAALQYLSDESKFDKTVTGYAQAALAQMEDAI